MKARFIVDFDDFDYRRWLACNDLAQIGELTRRTSGSFDLIVEGSKESIDQFAAELSYPPEEIFNGLH